MKCLNCGKELNGICCGSCGADLKKDRFCYIVKLDHAWTDALTSYVREEDRKREEIESGKSQKKQGDA